MDETGSTHVPVTYEFFEHVEGPFFHGTRSVLEAGAELVPGYGSNFQQGRVSNNIYFTALVDTAAWGAELATALAGSDERGHVYVVEPMGPFARTNRSVSDTTTRRYPTYEALPAAAAEVRRVTCDRSGWGAPWCAAARWSRPCSTVTTCWSVGAAGRDLACWWSCSGRACRCR